jgi:prevent-host-death family protein
VAVKRISASKFKATCLALMDEAQRTGESIVVTKRGKPVGKFVPMEGEGSPWADLGRLRGTGRVIGDIVEPVIDPEAWEALR